jgi:hypothetical protein
MQKRVLTLLVILLGAISASVSAAPVAYSINSDSGSDFHDGLYLIDLASGNEIERIGTVTSLLQNRALLDVEGLAFSANGTLYGIDDETLKLVSIDTGTALVDPGAEVEIAGLTEGSNDFGMTFACDDTLYITSVTRQSLYTMTLDGTATLVGSEGSLGVDISSLAAYGNPVRLYGLGNGSAGESAPYPNLYEIDTTNGSATLIGPLGPEVGNYAESGLAFDETGQLWAITDRRPLHLSSQVMRVNTSTGRASDVRNTTEQGFESLAITGPSGCNATGNGENARFVVQKRFDDGNNVTPVELSLRCNTGLPLEQSVTVTPEEGELGDIEVSFVVVDFTDGELSCEVREETPAGYSPDYDCQSATGCTTNAGAGPCRFENVGTGQENLCLIQNYVEPVEIVVTKEWLYPRDEVAIDDTAQVDLYCDSVFDGDGELAGANRMRWSWVFDGNPASRTATVYPDFSGLTDCWTVEQTLESAVESESSCGDSINIEIGDGLHHCTVTNSIFFESIPTLSQYGALIFAALMLFTGLVAARRF